MPSIGFIVTMNRHEAFSATGCWVCESIPKVDENSRCIGLLIYNQTERERGLPDHANYWHWRNRRNGARW